MASIKFNRKEFEKYIKINKETEEKISMLGTHLESINEQEIELEILPNRPDLFSLHGFVRAFLAFTDKKPGLREYKAKKSGFKIVVEKSLPREWPYAFGCIVKGLKFDDEKIKEIIDIQEKVGKTMLRDRRKGGIGLYPLEKITFPVKFTGMKPEEIKFRPLEYPNAITGRQILSMHPKGREYCHICQNWDRLPVFVDSKGVIMSMPPIINSHDVGKIDETTKDIFVEVTGNDFNNTQKALLIMVTSLADMGGEVYSIDCKQQNGKEASIPNLEPEKMKLNIENVNKLLGLNLQEREIKEYLEMMGYSYKNKEVLIPCYRTDILHEVDLIEDIAIAYGYENFIPEIPQISTIGEEDSKEIRKRKIAEILTGLNILEISSYHLITKEDVARIDSKNIIEVEDSKTDYKILRPNLLVNQLKTISENVDSEYPQRIFEVGKIFSRDSNQETGIHEKNHLAISISGNFTELKQILNYLEKMLSISLEIQETSNPLFIEGRTGKILLNGKEIGIIGELKPETLRAWKIKMPFSCLEINIEETLS